MLEKLKEGINFDYVCELTWKCKIRILLKCFWRQHFRENQDQGADFKDKSVAMKRDRANNEILWNNQKNGFDEKYFIHFRIVRILCERGYT